MKKNFSYDRVRKDSHLGFYLRCFWSESLDWSTPPWGSSLPMGPCASLSAKGVGRCSGHERLGKRPVQVGVNCDPRWTITVERLRDSSAFLAIEVASISMIFLSPPSPPPWKLKHGQALVSSLAGLDREPETFSTISCLNTPFRSDPLTKASRITLLSFFSSSAIPSPPDSSSLSESRSSRISSLRRLLFFFLEGSLLDNAMGWGVGSSVGTNSTRPEGKRSVVSMSCSPSASL